MIGGIRLFVGREYMKNALNLLKKTKSVYQVDLPGFEPGQTDPESVVLPLHHKSVLGLQK